jgi:hypothetical protein
LNSAFKSKLLCGKPVTLCRFQLSDQPKYDAVREVKPSRRGLAKHSVLECQGHPASRPLSPARFINLSFCQLLGHNLRVWTPMLLDRPSRGHAIMPPDRFVTAVFAD